MKRYEITGDFDVIDFDTREPVGDTLAVFMGKPICLCADHDAALAEANAEIERLKLVAQMLEL